MNTKKGRPPKILLDLNKLNLLNAKGYAGKFCLGDTVVCACGGENDGPRYILEKHAVFDPQTQTYRHRNHYWGRNR